MPLVLKRIKPTLELDIFEIHTYAEDLQRITLLRDKSQDKSERERYNNIIKIMQLVLAELNRKTVGGKRGRLSGLEE